MFEIISLHGKPFKRSLENPAERSPEKPRRSRRRSLRLRRLLVRSFVLLGFMLAFSAALFWWGQRNLLLETRANQGEVFAQYRLGEKELRAAQRSGDYAEALEWLHKAAAQGNVDAQSRLGYLFAKGVGVPQDGNEALNWFRRACEPREATEPVTLQATVVQCDYRKLAEWVRQLDSRGLKIASKNLEIAAVAQGRVFAELRTRDGSVYQRLRVQRIEPDGLTVEHSAGFAKLKRSVLPADLARLCQYVTDPTVAPFSAWTHTIRAAEPAKQQVRPPAVSPRRRAPGGAGPDGVRLIAAARD